jgi:ArsR family transcriptional regulator
MDSEYMRVFKAFTNESRIRVLEILCNGEECACVLLDDLKISQPTLSHHMKILCDSGIVKSRKAGKWNYYSINEDGCEYAGRLLAKIREKKNVEKIVKFMTGIYGVLKLFKKIFAWDPAGERAESH